jgi:DNA-binding Lrp family transcriptional regulator
LSKNSAETLKMDEIKVLDILRQHAKEDIGEIAKKCGFSRQKVWKVIKNLEHKKIIWGYSAVDDGEASDLKHFVLILKRNTKSIETAIRNGVITDFLDDYVPNQLKIENIYFTHGNYDGIVTFFAPDLVSAKMLVQEIMKKIGNYFNDYLLLETLFPIRKQGIKNPQLKNLVEFL